MLFRYAAMGLGLAFLGPVAAQNGGGEGASPPAHTEPFPNIGTGADRREALESLARAPELRRDVPARELLEQRRLLDAALSALAPQRPGMIDAYVVSVALDSDAVFAREAREAARVLAARYDAEGRALVLAGPDGRDDDYPRGSIEALFVALAGVSEILDTREDVIVLFMTSHGLKVGLTYHYGDSGYGILSPQRLRDVLAELGIERRIVIANACFSGIFVPALASSDTAILTAASAQRSSFGCEPDNDWTFYGDALVNRALRKPQSLADAAREAARTIAEWETGRRLLASLPQSRIGEGAREWLPLLEERMPREASAPVGRPAVAD